MNIDYDIFIDAQGLKCPQPLLLTKQAIKQLKKNQVLQLVATDPHTDLDIEVWCDRFEHEIIHTSDKNGVYKFWIRK
ncbi:MAG: sulfurtransferase TusA family protein [Marinicellaceae bacterium]